MGTHILWYHSFDVPIWYSVTYTYGADGLRTWKIGLFGDVPFTQYIWSGGNIAMEITGDKIVTYLYGLNRISRKIYGEQYRGVHKEYDDEGEITSQTPINYYHEVYLYDGHGNVVQLVNEEIIDYFNDTQYGKADFAQEFDTDGNGVANVSDLSNFLKDFPVTQSYHYDAFGNHLDEEKSNDTNYFRYCGEYWDKETGEVYLRARYYNPKTGRFATVDPAMDGTNWYVYCKGNPINFVDPWGLCSYDANGNWRHDTWEYLTKHGEGYYGAATSHKHRAEHGTSPIYGNCYSFAVGIATATDPGTISNNNQAVGIIGASVDEVSNYIIDDMNAIGRTARIIDGVDGEIYGNEYRIAVRVSNIDNYNNWDYHLMVQNNDGTWSEKHGRGGWVEKHKLGETPDNIKWTLYDTNKEHYNSDIIYLAVERGPDSK